MRSALLRGSLLVAPAALFVLLSCQIIAGIEDVEDVPDAGYCMNVAPQATRCLDFDEDASIPLENIENRESASSFEVTPNAYRSSPNSFLIATTGSRDDAG